MAYEEYDYYNEPATGSLKDSLYQILHGLTNEKNLRETGEGISRVRQALPGVTESVGRGAIAAVPGSIGDISEFARTYAPEIMEKKFGKERFFPTTREILDYVPRMTPTHEGATTLEDVGSVISPGVGGVVKDVALLTKGKPLGLSIMGPESALWKPEMAYQASKLEAKGKPAEEILEKTGMVRGLDNQWRMELSDKFAKLKGEGDTFGTRHGNVHPSNDRFTSNERRAQGVLVEDILHHPELFEAYPELGKIKVEAHGSTHNVKGSYKQSKNTISLREDLNPEEARSTLLHELTHGIQGKEEFNRGANAGQLIDYYAKQKQGLMTKIEDLNGQMREAIEADDMDKYRQLIQSRDVLSRRYTDMNPEELGYQDYLHHGGEAEARLVQRRANLSPEELRTTYPYQFTGKTGYGLDINPDEAIITTAHPGTINQPSQSVDYRGTHIAPYRTDDATTAPGHELNRTYPDDVYGPNAHRYYGDNSQMDKDTFALLQAAKGNPDHPITIYRAVPKEFAGEDIYTGDWVTPNLDYAKQHGLYFDDGYHIIEKTVPAKHIWTNADSIHEFGYDPSE